MIDNCIAHLLWKQKSCSNRLTSEIIKEVANIHWAAIGLLTIANVLERFDKISVNDRDCFDLLKVMLDLAKFLKKFKGVHPMFEQTGFPCDQSTTTNETL